jgi:ADP-dependent NAD(P)H-hydrate dehydratase / NAD(P)H-hydrate epimerase
MIELLTNAQMTAADRLTVISGTPGISLMEKAGRAVAEAVMSRLEGRRAVVIAGPGNNGGDGFVTARYLAENGHDVCVALVGDIARFKDDAAWAAERWAGPTINAVPELLGGRDLVVIDALFGAGLDRPVVGLPRAMIEAMNGSALPIVAIDLPSGVNGTTGAVMGVAVRAHHTVTFFRRKIGHVLLPGRDLCGAVEVVDIGIPDQVLETVRPSSFLNEPLLWDHVFPVPRTRDHKYNRGHVVVVSGGISTTGAARLAARGALRAGAGLVTLATPRDSLAVNAAASLAVMVRPVDGAAELREFLSDTRHNAVVIGPGGGVGTAMCDNVQPVLASEAAGVLDADALTSFSGNPSGLFTMIRKNQGRQVVLTPHEGEFSKLFNEIYLDIKYKSKLEKVRAAALISRAVVLLKGADTVVAAPDGRVSVAQNAPAYLATAGAGDVLSGIIAGLLAQHMPAFEAASAAVWLHGEAAREFGAGLIAEDLPDMLPKVYGRLFSNLSRQKR